jgi:ATP-dependent DNA ligase
MGWRALPSFSPWSRSGPVFAESNPAEREISRSVEAIHRQETASFIADGEIVTFEGAITSFAKLQARMQVRYPSADLIRKIPVWFYLFDLLYLDRYDIRQVPLRYRKQVLRNASGFQGSLA